MKTEPVPVALDAQRHLPEPAATREGLAADAPAAIVDEAWWEDACRQEREARLRDQDSPEILQELDDWDALNDDEFP
ncbi:MAG: hypothetical protein FWD59_09810 [Micrococcales bacterium]|nr:hypothetical protein [Micrococcales bacterium]